MVPVITIAETDKPVITFLNEQARIRDALPLRSLQTCTTCRHQKVVNPDYQRLVERNRKIKGLSGFLGASISSSGVSPFILVGRILPLVKMDPDYVCPRCQGLDADERLVVFCPNCGERRDEAALRKCQRCEHDFRQALEPETLWQPVGTAAELFAPPPPAPPPPPPERAAAGPRPHRSAAARVSAPASTPILTAAAKPAGGTATSGPRRSSSTASPASTPASPRPPTAITSPPDASAAIQAPRESAGQASRPRTWAARSGAPSRLSIS